MEREKLITTVIEAGGSLKVRSALNPILWLCATVSAPTIISTSLFSQAPSLLIIIGIMPIIIALFAFLFLLFFDRDKLQSEEYQIRKKTLEMIEQSDSPEPIDPSAQRIISAKQAALIAKTSDGEADA